MKSSPIQTPASPNIGQQIKHYRKEKRMTLEQLALKADLSASYISKIERGVVSPSAEAIQKLSYTLGLTASELVLPRLLPPNAQEAETPAESYVITKEARSLIYEFGDSLIYQSVMGGHPNFEVNVLTLRKPEKEAMRSVHNHDELGIVANGILELKLDNGACFTLHEGDGIMIRAGMPHTARCLSPEGCVSYWIEILN